MQYTPHYLCDLHCHTTRSDGYDSPYEFILHARALGMKAAAITDHDIVPPDSVALDGREVDICRAARDLGLLLIKGTEISCDTQVEDVHLIGFGCRWDSGFFSNLEEMIDASKMESYKKLIERLNEHGIHVTWDEFMESTRGSTIQKKRLFELIASKGYTKSWQEAKIMVNRTPEFQIKREKPDPIKIIEEIHASGGIAILAHPHLIEAQIDTGAIRTNRDGYIQNLIDKGLDGIEACYTYDKTSYKGNQTNDEIRDEITSKYSSKISILSGGSDYHGDEKNGVENARCIGECGIDFDYFCGNTLLKRLIPNP